MGVDGGVFNCVGGAAEEVPPEGAVEELEQGENAGGAWRGDGAGGAAGGGGGGGGREEPGGCCGGFAVEEEGEQAEAEGVALFVEAGDGS